MSLDAGPSWRELAVARSLDAARTRAENRVQRFLDAASELIGDGSRTGFTVQEVVDRSGQSLRSFYQYFNGKHELLLALFEESVRTTAERLREMISEDDQALDRLHRFVVEYDRLCRPNSSGGRADGAPLPIMAEFGQQLLTRQPEEAARAFQPLVALLLQLLHEGVDAGVVRADMDPGVTAGLVLEAVMFNSFSSTIAGRAPHAGADDSAELLWQLVFRGLGASSR